MNWYLIGKIITFPFIAIFFILFCIWYIVIFLAWCLLLPLYLIIGIWHNDIPGAFEFWWEFISAPLEIWWRD